MHRNRVTEFDIDNSERSDFIRIDGAWINENWEYVSDYDDITFGTARELASHRRQDSELDGVGIDGVEPGDVEADDEPYDNATIIARDGTHIWNQGNPRFTARAELDLNLSNADPFDLEAEYCNETLDNLPENPSELQPAVDVPEYE